ncbi:MAG: flagellar assembly protein FliW [Lachnospiraceae bacterium]|nr:flagellar assembly protein FliW [Lachnospiraceae bacterium]
MEVSTKLFGTIDVGDDKIIEFPEGILGFPELKKFTLMYDNDKNTAGGMNFLVSLDEPAFALPVVPALIVEPGYSPKFTENIEATIGVLTEENALVLVTMTIPADVTKMTVNLNAPIVVNINTKKGMQSVVANEEYDVKYPIYDKLKKE